MSSLPRYSPWRPDFEAPGPHVQIMKKENIEFDDPISLDEYMDDEDNGVTRYRYYESNKILGKLYRAIDERKIFKEMQARSRNDGDHDGSTLMHAVWGYVEERCQLIQWKHKVEWARSLREMCVLYSIYLAHCEVNCSCCRYEECLQNIMVDYSDHPKRPLTELEAFVGNILGPTGAQSKTQRELSTSLKEKFDNDAAYFVKCITRDDEDRSDEALERSLACFAVSLEDRSLGREKLRSFKYLAAAVCLREVDKLPKV